MSDAHEKSPIGISGTAAPERRSEAGTRAPPARPRKAPRPKDFVPTQEQVLQEWQGQQTLLVVLLQNGTRIRGTLHAYDGFMIALSKGPEIQLIYKQAIMTIGPAPTEPRITRAPSQSAHIIREPADAVPADATGSARPNRRLSIRKP
ncbi:MAG: RNA chaperone Hfq [Betaproteobacteria bacterium]